MNCLLGWVEGAHGGWVGKQAARGGARGLGQAAAQAEAMHRPVGKPVGAVMAEAKRTVRWMCSGSRAKSQGQGCLGVR